MNSPSPVKSKEVLISGPTIPVLETVHDDNRRTIREAILPQHDGSIRRVTAIAIKAANDGESITLGNHYHNAPEYFTILAGKPTVRTAHIQNPELITEQTHPDGAHIIMEPGQAHAFVFPPEGGELRSTMDATFEDGGMHPHHLA